jgi:hypothetical protein
MNIGIIKATAIPAIAEQEVGTTWPPSSVIEARAAASCIDTAISWPLHLWDQYHQLKHAIPHIILSHYDAVQPVLAFAWHMGLLPSWHPVSR